MNVPVPVNGSRTCTPCIGQGCAELLPQDVFDAADDEVDDLDRRVDDAEGLGSARESELEELLVEFGDDLLLALGVVDALGAQPDRLVERLQGLGFLSTFCSSRMSSMACMTLDTGLCSANE